MMRSLFSGVSGLKGHQTRMDVVGHNISNVNTVGYKASRVTFADTLYQTTAGASAPQGNLGGINPKQIGLGANVASIDTIFGDASVQGTGKNTDVALAGNGLFTVKNNNGTYYTRSGAFEFDADGNYVMSGNGSFVQGWMARENGELVTTEQPGNITIKAGKSMQPQMTTAASYLNNLNADTKGYEIASIVAKYKDGTQKSLGTYTESSVGEMSLGMTGTTKPIPLEDTYKEKNGMEVTATLTKTKLKFDQTGRYVSGDATVTMTYKREGEEEPKTHKVTVSLGALTQYSGSSTIRAETDGNAEGVLKNVTIDNSGTITGVYSNGKIKAEAQLAIAQFNNASGLTRAGGNFFQQSNNSGAANIKTAADLGCTITPSALEMSNVDIADQFSDMIVTQRGFQANSKTITVGDEMLETLINMKR